MKKTYDTIIPFVPDAIIILSAGTIHDPNSHGVGGFRSTRVDESDAFGTLFGEARIVAAAELALYFENAKVVTTSARSPGEPTHALILREELADLSIPKERVVLEEKSGNTLTQIGECMKIVCDNGWTRVVMVTNEYQIPRAQAMYEHFEKLNVPEAMKKAVEEVKTRGVQVVFVGAERILPYRDKLFIDIIEKMKASAEYKKRLENEERGTKMVVSGEYGRQPTDIKDKYERKA